MILAILAVEEEELGRRHPRRRRWWIKPWLEERPSQGDYYNLMQKLMQHCKGDFKSYLRMEPEMFHELVDRVGPRVAKKCRYVF